MSIVMRLNVSSYINGHPFVILYVTHAVIGHIRYTAADIHAPQVVCMCKFYKITVDPLPLNFSTTER